MQESGQPTAVITKPTEARQLTEHNKAKANGYQRQDDEELEPLDRRLYNKDSPDKKII